MTVRSMPQAGLRPGTAGLTCCRARPASSPCAGPMPRAPGAGCTCTAGTSMSSSTEAQAVAADPRATGWTLPGADGGVVLPWVVFVIGEGGPMAMLPPADVRDLGG